MANFAGFCDDGFQGRIFPHQRAKLREYFCLNPWPDTEFVYRIAAEIGVPVFVIFNYFEFVRCNQKQQSEVSCSSQQYSDDVQLLNPTNKLEQDRLPPKPVFQSKELSAQQVQVDRFSHDDTTRKDDLDNILDEILKSPKCNQEKNVVHDVHLSDVDEEILPPIRANSQDELMLALSEVGLSTGQMSKFCSDSDIYKIPEDYPQDFPKMPTSRSSARNKPIQFVNIKRNDADIWPNLVESDLELDSSNYDVPGPPFYNNSNAVLTRGKNTDSSLSMAPYQVKSYSPTQVMLSNTDENNMFALSSVHCAAVRGKRLKLGENLQNIPSHTFGGLSGSFTEYEVVKDESNDLQAPLFHRYIKQKSSPKKILPKATSTDVSSKKSDPILITSHVDEVWPNHGCSKPQQQNCSIELSAEPQQTLTNSPSKPKKSKGKPGPMVLPQEGPVVPRKRNTRCRTCSPCRAPDCGECMYCLDKPKFGGPNRRKNACVHRRCANMVPVNRRRSLKSAPSSVKEVGSVPGMPLDVLDDIPVEKEGFTIGGKGFTVGNHDLVESKRFLNLRSTPVKRRAPTNGTFDHKNFHTETANLDDDFEYLDNGNIEDAQSCTPANVEKHLFNQYLDSVAEGEDSKKYSKLDEVPKKVRKNSYESEEGKVLLKEKLSVVKSDHSYADVNRQYFEGMNSDIGFLANEFERESDESIDIGDFYDENTTEHSEENKYLSVHPSSEAYLNKITHVDEEREFDVFEDGIVPLEIAEESQVACNTSICDNGDSGEESYEMVKGDGLPLNFSQAKEDVDAEYISHDMEGISTEDQQTEEYCAELDSSDRKEIEEQLTEDVEEPLHVYNDEANDSSLSSFNFKTVVDANDHLLLECVEDVVVKPPFTTDKNASNIEKVEERSFQSVFENTLLGQSSRSSNLGTEEIDLSPLGVGIKEDKKEMDGVANNLNVSIDPM